MAEGKKIEIAMVATGAAEAADGGRSCDRRTGFPGATEWQQPIASSYIYNSVELGLSVFASPEFLEFNP